MPLSVLSSPVARGQHNQLRVSSRGSIRCRRLTFPQEDALANFSHHLDCGQLRDEGRQESALARDRPRRGRGRRGRAGRRSRVARSKAGDGSKSDVGTPTWVAWQRVLRCSNAAMFGAPDGSGILSKRFCAFGDSAITPSGKAQHSPPDILVSLTGHLIKNGESCCLRHSLTSHSIWPHEL